MVPKDWEYSTLESLCEPSAPITYGVLKPGDYFADGIPLLQIKDLLSDLSEPQCLHHISPELDEQYRRSRIKTNDILISLVGTVGRIGIVPKQLNNANIHRNLGRIRTKSFEFLVHYLHSDIAKNRFGISSSGSSQSALNLTVLRSLKVPVPPFPEQQKIAKILSTWDKAIGATERLIENSTQQKKALMQQLLTGKKRLLDESGKRFEGEWEEVKLGDVSDVRDGTHDSPEFIDVGYPLITSKNLLSSGRLDLSNVKLISEEDYLQINKRSNVNNGDILFGMIGTIGNPVRVKSSNYAIKNVALIKETGILLNSFLIYYLSSHDIDKQIYRLNAGGTQKFVALGVLRNLVVSLPTQKEQQKIATVLTNADKEIELLEQQLADLQQEKKALMQVLLTGKKRVVVDGES
ncbi:restriction endonuclease subunit S [Psychrobacter immobilis]|uniref:restriction endonuclease subunit S n=1 Tax=Psychrobacter immobilis TaxID=498 RepID=UPI00191A9D88|nr:restriction endonuclease subunit S [Psychrobacter immobilis]